jgi:ribosomal protein S17
METLKTSCKNGFNQTKVLTMKIIEKKTWPELFEKVKNREKNFDVRLADFKCLPGDVLMLKEWDPKTKNYTGRVIRRKVKFIINTKDLEKFWSKSEIKKHGFQVIGF